MPCHFTAYAANGSQPTYLILPSEHADHFVVSPEMITNYDRQLMEAILKRYTASPLAKRMAQAALEAGANSFASWLHKPKTHPPLPAWRSKP
eukprot:1743250-Pleurochrysis_carterae.AAC.2